jgi:uncharacterized protein (UPF0262 family)
MRIIIADELWGTTSTAREQEWQQALMDFNVKHDGQPPDITVARREDGGATLRLGGLAVGEVEVGLSFDLLRDHFRDYRDVIARIARATAGSFGMRDYEALDMAKKGVHDEAGFRIRKALRPHVELDLKVARRIFTVLFLILADIPADLVTNHRCHGPRT